MKETEQRIRISENSPAMTSPLVNQLHFDGINDYGNDIILGQATDIPHLDNHTKIYLWELATLTHTLPNEYQTISLKEYAI